MVKVVLRDANRSDEVPIIGCINAAYAQARAEIRDLPDVASGIVEDIQQRRTVMAEVGGQVAGVIIFEHGDGATKIFNLAVDPAYQGLGLARRLMALAEDEARGQGSDRLALRTHARMTATRQMYLHLGWREADESGNTVSFNKRL